MKLINKMENKSLEQFASESITDSDLREVFIKLMSDYKNESARQHLIRAIIELYELRYPNEMREFAKIMEKKKEIMANEYAADKAERQRLVFKFPESLMKRFELMVKDPPILSQSNPMTKEELDEWTWFMREFPQFTVPNKI